MINKKSIAIIIGAGLSLGMMALVPEKSSSGAPASHTGAPGEVTCAVSTCHDDNSVNSGSAQLFIDLGQAKNYVPGQEYNIKVRITDPGVQRFGFQIVALTDIGKLNAGDFVLTDTYRTQITKNDKGMQDRQYVTYTYDGTDAVQTGVGEWSLKWKAPAQDIGAVTFYASGVSGNDDETDKGDHVYTVSKKLVAFKNVQPNIVKNEEN